MSPVKGNLPVTSDIRHRKAGGCRGRGLTRRPKPNWRRAKSRRMAGSGK